MNFSQMAYLPLWFVKVRVLSKQSPLQTVLFITDYCNLSCKHCSNDVHQGRIMKPYVQIEEELKYSYDLGSRFVDFEGGEPILWKDRNYNINDVISLAKSIGFYSVTITTNAQLPFDWVKADSIWVSLDGYKGYHDAIRGKGAFDKLDVHISKCGHPALSVNMAVNNINKDSVEDTIKYTKSNPAIKSISINFHTPYPGTEELVLPWDERTKIIDKVIRMKKQGYPIMNSTSGLKIMKRKDFKKECWVSNFILTDGTRLKTCPGKQIDICDNCGFCMSGEMYSIMRLKPDTITSGLKLRF